MSNKFKQILQKISESPKNNSQMSKKHNNITYLDNIKGLGIDTLKEFHILNTLKQSILKKIMQSTKGINK